MTWKLKTQDRAEGKQAILSLCVTPRGYDHIHKGGSIISET